MNFVRKTATTFGVISFAVLLLAALAPKAAHGVAAALVQVTNTASNAVPTEDGPGNFPFAAALCVEFGNSDCGTSASGFIVPLTTSGGAAVKRLVIEDVSASCEMGAGSALSTGVRVPLPVDNVNSEGPIQDFVQYFIPLTSIGSTFGVGHSTVRIYADPGAEIATTVFGAFGGSNGASCTMYLTGHFETK